MSRFLFNGCETDINVARPSDDLGNPDRSGTPNEDGNVIPRPAPESPQPEVTERELRDLLHEALHGICFLTNQVTELIVEHKKLNVRCSRV